MKFVDLKIILSNSDDFWTNINYCSYLSLLIRNKVCLINKYLKQLKNIKLLREVVFQWTDLWDFGFSSRFPVGCSAFTIWRTNFSNYVWNVSS
jgi:hypothetical protein